MPDLIAKGYFYCKQSTDFTFKVGDYTVTHNSRNRGKHQFNWGCTCRAGKYGKCCKHITEAKKHYCGWDQFLDCDEPKDGCCPGCGGEITSRMIGI